MKPCLSEVSGSKISSFFFYFYNFQKKLFTTHKYKCSLKFWLECVMWDTLSFNTVTCGKIELVLFVCVCVHVCVCCTLTCSSGDYLRKWFKKSTKVRKKSVFPVITESQKPWHFMLEWLRWFLSLKDVLTSCETEALKEKWWWTKWRV